VRFGDPAVQHQIDGLVADLEEDPFVTKPVLSWLREFNLWRDGTAATTTIAAASDAAAANAAAAGKVRSAVDAAAGAAGFAASAGWATAAERAMPFHQALELAASACWYRLLCLH
jgi:hypothetical protein